jgi:virulence factor Mce-like protein
MRDGDVIDVDRTAVPVEWDEIKNQLMRLSTDLGPGTAASSSSVGRFIDSAANAMDGNGDKLRETIRQLTGLSRILADGSGDITDIVANLQTFVTVLRDSSTQIVQFQDRLATVSSVLDGSRSELDAALTNLSSAVDDVQRFVAGSRNQTAEQVERLADVVGNLSVNQTALKNLLLALRAHSHRLLRAADDRGTSRQHEGCHRRHYRQSHEEHRQEKTSPPVSTEHLL